MIINRAQTLSLDRTVIRSATLRRDNSFEVLIKIIVFFPEKFRYINQGLRFTLHFSV